MKKRPFVIVFVARSGSSLITYDLQQHPEVNMFAEAFGNASLPDGIEQTDTNRLEFLDRYWHAYRRPIASELARGFKFQFNVGEPQFDDLVRFADYLSNADAAVVVLKRRRMIRQAISAIRAQELMKWTQSVTGVRRAHIDRDAAAEVAAYQNQPTRVDIRRLDAVMQSIGKNVHAMQDFTDRLSVTLDLEYDEYVSRRLSEFDRLCQAIGVGSPDKPPEEKFKKITPENLSAVIENYDEVAEYAQQKGQMI